MNDEITRETAPKHIEPEEMLYHLSKHILALMNEGAGASGIAPLLDIYFRQSDLKSIETVEKTSTIKEKILKIMSLSLEINPPETEGIGELTTAVFVNWSPHCNVLDVSIYFDGWKSDTNPDKRFSVYTNSEEASEHLDMIITFLESIKEIQMPINLNNINSDIT